LQGCIQCIQSTTHTLSPSQSVGILKVLSEMRGTTGKSNLAELESLLIRLSLHLNSRLSACSNEELISSCKSMAMLQFQPGLLLSSILSRITLDLPCISNDNIVWLAWSLAKLDCKKPQTNLIIKECLDRATRAEGVQLSTSQLAVVIWVCGRLSYRNDKVLKPVLVQLVKGSTSVGSTAEALSIRLVANVVWSCAKLGFSTELLASWSVRQLGPDLELLASCSDPQTICNLAWGLWRLGHKPQPRVLSAFVAASERCVESLGSPASLLSSPTKPTELVALLSALSGWKARPSKMLLDSVEKAMQDALSSRGQEDCWPADVLIGCAWSLVE